ncbi:MAG: tryptophan-rich sensory protein [Chloroflexi bacterium AL-W]|nr:tryptophan-rich sensory protein [Chloroflexi bacterium AL-N1]NOK70124.1 tryptophan-rich sensory protein [Chloroflexi bacterium AL-N10]NOK77864.1 tryptophan-rich sensory protein [Chloroflexi bacterium AL-N5]NOK84873.1 tryptophan-rich sensory protein [Chloroflexi bacterium AL-W]NOK91852.1 tryptophan-rich sensory protein [Chloroflexi bacterium AL-N15]
MNTTARQILNIIALVLVIAVNALANMLPLNGVTTGELSDRYPILTVPAGYAFSIWSLIYTSLIGFVIYQALPAQRDNPRIRSADPFFLLSCVANIGWMFTWHYQILWLNILMMVGILINLIFILLRLGMGSIAVSRAEYWLVRFPFSVYTGWITVATIVNMTVILYAANWGGWGVPAAVWAALLLVIGAAIGLFVGFRLNAPAYTLVVVWAYIAIAVEHADVTLVASMAGAMAAVVALTLIVNAVRGRFGQPRLAT